VSGARITLHLAALFAPLLAVSAWCLILYRVQSGDALGVIALVGGLGILSAQIAALLRWRALDARARKGHGAWLTGIGMAALTHVVFGILLDVALVFAIGGWREAAGTGHPTDLLLQSLFFFFASVVPVGLVTFPATALLAHWIAALRRKEFVDAIA
jgi:hypothetical protein